MRTILACAATLAILSSPVRAADADALAISANIQARHVPFGTLLDPIFASSAGTQVAGYTRCGDSALWTGAYLAAESFRYKVTRSPDALRNLKGALAALKALTDVTGDNRLARCMAPIASPYAAGIAAEEAANDIHQAPPWIWAGNTSRDQVVGVFFGLGVAFDLVDDAAVKSDVSDLATRLIGFISRHQWSPDDDLGSTFGLRPEELQMLLQVARHVNPDNTVSGPLIVLPTGTAVQIDVQGLGSYFKFNLDYMSLFQLVSLQDNAANRDAYNTLRTFTASHQNPFFNMIDRALRGPDDARDAETRALLGQWLLRSRRDFYVDVSSQVSVCGDRACQPVPVALRSPATFLWEVSPFQLRGGLDGFIENSGLDYILPYWMARYYGVIQAGTGIQSAAAPIGAVAPGSLASLYAQDLAAAPAQATTLPLPTTLGGVTLTVTDSAGVRRSVPLLYVSPGQINFLLPDGVAPGTATVLTGGSGVQQAFTAAVQPVAPALFSMNGTGSGVAAALAVAVLAGNPQTQSPVPVFQCTAAGCVAVPIDTGLDRPVYLSLYGTGIRNRTSLAGVTVTINGINLSPLYAGPSPDFAGLDQVNVGLSLALRGSGESAVTVTVDGHTSNPVTIKIQ